MSSSPAERPTRVDHLTAIFVLFHVSLAVVMGIGRQRMPEVLEPIEVAWNDMYRGTKKVARVYGENVGTKQYGWSMFSGVPRTNGRVVIEGRSDGEWSVLFEEGVGGWRSWEFRHYRWRELLRGFHFEDEPSKTFDQFVDWSTREVFADRPEVCAVRVRLLKADTLSPEALQDGERRRFDVELRRSKTIERSGGCP